MESTLILPHGVRFPERNELTGPRGERDRLWAQIGRARLRTGFVVRASASSEFACFIEANVDAPRLWEVFSNLVTELLGEESPCQLLFGDGEDVHPVDSRDLGGWLELLRPFAFVLAHDGWTQFGLASEGGDAVSGVLVTPTKHLQIWAQSREIAVVTLRRFGLEEVTELDLLARYPIVLEPLKELPIGALGLEDLYARLREWASSPQGAPESGSNDDAAR